MSRPATPSPAADDAIREIQRRHGIVGRADELALAVAVLASGRHLLLEGPVGVGKTTIALAVCDHLGRTTVRVDGDDRYSEAKLTGWFDPPLVLQAGFGEESFTAGPLVEAMRSGAVLFINEFNRMPETVQNVLLPALDERRIGVPHLGEVRAAPGFQVIATQNPVEYVATGHLSEALRDRFEHLGLAYQAADEELAIVAAEAPGADRTLAAAAVRLARATRGHPGVRKGASVRGAIATVEIAGRLGAVTPAGVAGRDERASIDPIAFRRAAAAALRTRIELRDDAGGGFERVLDELVATALAVPDDGDGRPPPGDDAADPPAEADDPEPASVVAIRTTATRPRPGEARPDAWRLATELTAGRLRGMAEADVEVARGLAAAEVLRRAAALVGPLRGRTRVRRRPQPEAPHGELDVGATLENAAGKPHPDPHDWIVERREEERRRVVLMIDESGSMRGEPMALAAVATAVLALKVPPGDLGVVAFSNVARDVVVLGEAIPPAELVRRLLARPCGGATNLEAALAAGERQLSTSADPRRTAVLVTDGQYTAGADPRPVARRFAALHVLHTSGAGPADSVWITPVRQAGADIARLGGGRRVPVTSFDELPRRMLELADGVLRQGAGQR